MEEDYKKSIDILRSLREGLSNEQRQLAKMLANYMLSIKQKNDYEGIQIFPYSDYSRRN